MQVRAYLPEIVLPVTKNFLGQDSRGVRQAGRQAGRQAHHQSLVHPEKSSLLCSVSVCKYALLGARHHNNQTVCIPPEPP